MRITIAFDLDGADISNWSIDSDAGAITIERHLAVMVALRSIARLRILEMHDRGDLPFDVVEMMRAIDETPT